MCFNVLSRTLIINILLSSSSTPYLGKTPPNQGETVNPDAEQKYDYNSYVFLSHLSYFGIGCNVCVESRKEKTLLVILFKDFSWLAPLWSADTDVLQCCSECLFVCVEVTECPCVLACVCVCAPDAAKSWDQRVIRSQNGLISNHLPCMQSRAKIF